ncbi:MAG: hypothetical protein WCL04_02285 [Verrucomicrobiota bacterium]
MPRRQQKGSVLLIVLVTIVFATTALIAFMERADDDLIIPMRHAGANRMRAEAYAALETTLAVLVDFRAANNNVLRSPAEGWDDPLNLDWVQYTPASPDRTVKVTFEDESGKMSLPTVTAQNLTDYFTFYGLSADEVSLLRDSFLVWMQRNYVPSGTGAVDPTTYQQEVIPFTPPGRALRSWDELRSIDGVSEYFFDANGALTPLGKRFTSAYSLYNFPTPNVNGGKPDTLAVLGKLDVSEQQAVLDVLKSSGSGTGMVKTLGFFSQLGDVATAANTVNALTGLGVNITALRINVTVKEGLSVFTLSTVVTWPTNGATLTPAPAPPSQATAANNTTPVTTAALQTPQLNYPYTILDITENDLDPADQPAQAPEPDSDSDAIPLSPDTPFLSPNRT